MAESNSQNLISANYLFHPTLSPCLQKHIIFVIEINLNINYGNVKNKLKSKALVVGANRGVTRFQTSLRKRYIKDLSVDKSPAKCPKKIEMLTVSLSLSLSSFLFFKFCSFFLSLYMYMYI